MSKHRENIFSKIDCLSLEVMLRYTQDKSSMKERNSVERHMLECELCRDAVEGYELMTDKDSASLIVSGLNQKLEVKSDDSFVIRRVVAGVGTFVVLAGGLFYLNQNLNTKEQSAIVTNTKEVDSVTNNSSSNLQKSEDIIAMDKKLEVPGAEKKQKFELYNSSPGEIIQKEEAADINSIVESSPSMSAPVKTGDFEVQEESSDLNAVVEIVSPSASDMKGAVPANRQVKEEEISLKDDVSERERSAKKSKVSSSAYSRAAGASEDNAEPNILDQAIQKYNEKKHAEASALLEQYIKLNTDNSKALYYNGLSYFDAGNWGKAIDNFIKINKSSIHFEDARWTQALALLNKGDKKSAKKILTEISESESKYKQQAVEELKKL